MDELKFCWGEPYCVREALKDYYKKRTTGGLQKLKTPVSKANFSSLTKLTC